MDHFDILCSLLKQSNRNLSNHRIRKLTKLNSRQFYRRKQEFILPLKHVISISQTQPVRLILDYVLISGKLQIINRPFSLVHNPANSHTESCLVILFVLAQVDDQLYPMALDFWEAETFLTQEGEAYFDKIELAENLMIQLLQAGLNISEVLCDAGFTRADFLKLLNQMKIPYICRFPMENPDRGGVTQFQTALWGSWEFFL